MCDVIRIGDNDYCLMSRTRDCFGEYGYEKPDSRKLFPAQYLEVWKNKECLRSLKVKDFFTARLNGYIVGILVDTTFCSPGPSFLKCYSLQDFLNNDIRSEDLKPIFYTSFIGCPDTLFLTKNQIIWSIRHNYGKDDCFLCGGEPCSRDVCAVNSLNFWYSLNQVPQNTDLPRQNVLCNVIRQ